MKRLFLCAALVIASLNLGAQEKEHKALVNYLSGFKDFKEISFNKVKNVTIGEMINEKVDFFDKLTVMDNELIALSGNSDAGALQRLSDDSQKMISLFSLLGDYIDRIDEVAATIYSVHCTYSNDKGEKRDVIFEGLFSTLGELTSVRVQGSYWQFVGSRPNYIIPEFRDILFAF